MIQLVEAADCQIGGYAVGLGPKQAREKSGGQAAGLFSCLFGSDADGATADLTVGSFDELYRYLVSESREGKSQ